jgi:TRAP-type C4-dicarboxylate transport system, small permease component
MSENVNSAIDAYKDRTAFERFVLKLDKAMMYMENTFSIACFSIMFVLIIAAIMCRYVFHIPFIWSEEASRYLMVSGIYIGVSMGFREKAHMGLTAIVDALPEGPRKAMEIALDIVVAGTCIFFTYYAFTFMLQVQSAGQKAPALRIPMWIVYIPMVVGFSFSAIRVLMRFLNDYICERPILFFENEEIQAE